MSKRKPHNPLKRFQRQAEAALSGLCFGMKPGDESGFVIAYRLKDGKSVRVGLGTAKLLNECEFKYVFLLVVNSKEKNGKDRCATQFERLKVRYLHSDLIDHLNAQIDAILDAEKAKGNEIVSAGWLAMPVPHSDDDLLFEQMLGVLTGEK